MPLDEATLKVQLARANEELAAWVRVLEERGVSAADRRTCTVWRKLNSACNVVRVRIKATQAVKRRDEEAARRKADKLSGAVTEKEPKGKPKSKGAAKDKAAKKAERSEKPAKAEKSQAEPKDKEKKKKA
jgi:hypothetical protein